MTHPLFCLIASSVWERFSRKVALIIFFKEKTSSANSTYCRTFVMGNAYSTVAGGFTNVTVHFPTLAGGVGGLFVVVVIIGASVWCLRRNKKGRGMPHHQVKIQFLNEHV